LHRLVGLDSPSSSIVALSISRFEGFADKTHRLARKVACHVVGFPVPFAEQFGAESAVATGPFLPGTWPCHWSEQLLSRHLTVPDGYPQAERWSEN
jgi:hypothetical protein